MNCSGRSVTAASDCSGRSVTAESGRKVHLVRRSQSAATEGTLFGAHRAPLQLAPLQLALQLAPLQFMKLCQRSTPAAALARGFSPPEVRAVLGLPGGKSAVEIRNRVCLSRA